MKGFVKTNLLQPGESQTFNFTLNASDLASFSTSQSAWVADAGTYTVKFGTSETALQSATFKLGKAIVTQKTNKALAPKKSISELKRK